MANLRVGLVGLGKMGRQHARVLRNLSGVELVGICEPVGEIDNQIYSDLVVRNVEQLIEKGIDYAVVAAPTASHLKIGKELAASGIHTMLEKPLSNDANSAAELVELFKNLVGAVGHIERYNPALQEAKRRLEQLGSLYQVASRRQGPFPGRISDVGVIMDLATHDIDLTVWVTSQKYHSVSALTAHRSGRDNEDIVVVVGSLSDGTISNHLVNWVSPLKERVTVLTGENGSFVADTLTGDLTYFANGAAAVTWDNLAQFRGVTQGDVVRYAFPKDEPLVKEHESFRDAVLGKDSGIVTMKEGLATIEVAEAIAKSAKQRASVKVY